MRTLLPITFGLLLLTVLEFRVIELIHRDSLTRSVKVSASNLTGYPVLKVWQNRLLGPIFVHAFATTTRILKIKSYQIVNLLILIGANCACFFQFRRASGSNLIAWLATLASALLFIFLQDRILSLTWDYFDLLFMTFFAWAVFKGASLPFLSLLFFAALLNRESALFIALWIMLDAFSFSSSRQRKQELVNWKQLLLGAVLMLVGIAWTHYLRNTLCVAQTAVLPQRFDYVGDQFWMLPEAVEMLRSAHALDRVIPFAVIGAVLFLLMRAWSTLSDRAWKIGVLLSAMLAVNILFGRITETRIWLLFIPFILWMAYAVLYDERKGEIQPMQASVL